MTISPFDGAESPYGPALGVDAAGVDGAGASPQPSAAASGVDAPIAPPMHYSANVTVGPPTPYAPVGVSAPQPYLVARPFVPRPPRNVAGGWALGLGIAGFVFTAGGIAISMFAVFLSFSALGLGILGIVRARALGLRRAAAVWGVCLAALPVIIGMLRFFIWLLQLVS